MNKATKFMLVCCIIITSLVIFDFVESRIYRNKIELEIISINKQVKEIKYDVGYIGPIAGRYDNLENTIIQFIPRKLSDIENAINRLSRQYR